MRSFGEIIKSQRQKLRLTQRQVADAIEVSDAYICSLESEKRVPPPFATVVAIAETLQLDVEQLWRVALKHREKQALEKSRRKIMTRRGNDETDDSLPRQETVPEDQIDAFFGRPEIQMVAVGIFRKQPSDMSMEEKQAIFLAINKAQESILDQPD